MFPPILGIGLVMECSFNLFATFSNFPRKKWSSRHLITLRKYPPIAIVLLPSLLHISCKEHEIFHHLYFKYPLLSQCGSTQWGEMLTPVCSGTACNGKLKHSFIAGGWQVIYMHKTLIVGHYVIFNYVLIAGFLSVNVWGMIQIKNSMLCLECWH